MRTLLRIRANSEKYSAKGAVILAYLPSMGETAFSIASKIMDYSSLYGFAS
jgi:hypothetical protein